MNLNKINKSKIQTWLTKVKTSFAQNMYAYSHKVAAWTTMRTNKYVNKFINLNEFDMETNLYSCNLLTHTRTHGIQLESSTRHKISSINGLICVH